MLASAVVILAPIPLHCWISTLTLSFGNFFWNAALTEPNVAGLISPVISHTVSVAGAPVAGLAGVLPPQATRPTSVAKAATTRNRVFMSSFPPCLPPTGRGSAWSPTNGRSGSAAVSAR